MKKLINQVGVINTLPLLLSVIAIGIISFLLVTSTAPFSKGLFKALNPKPVSNAATTSFFENFDGPPTTPQRWVPPGWDLTLSPDNDLAFTKDYSSFPVPNCGGGTLFTTPGYEYEYGVFKCSNHLMTKINEGGYGFMLLTPPALVDFSQGEAVIKWDISTLSSSGRDWQEFWVSPPDYSLLLDAERWGQNKPQKGIQIKMEGGSSFTGWVYNNFNGTEITTNPADISQIVVPSDSRLDTFELHISRTHIKFGIPQKNYWWVDTDVADLGWDKGIFHFGQSSYRPKLPCTYNSSGQEDINGIWNGSCGPSTWHFDNIGINPAIPFTIIRGDKNLLNSETSNQVSFPQSAPAGSRLRFTGTANKIEVSFDNGVNWIRASIMPQPATNPEGDEHPDDYFVPNIPPGTKSVLFRGERWWGGDWTVNNIAIYAINFY